MQEIKTERYKGSILLKLAVACFAVFFIVSLVVQQVRITDKKEELEALKVQLNAQEIKNQEIKNSLENSGSLKDYAEKQARRDLDYAMPGERIFVDVAGSD